MTIKDINFTLKDGRCAVIRNPKEEDVSGMLEYLRTAAGETDFLMNYPEECVKYTPDGEKALFERVNSADNETMLVCLVDGKIAGNCQITWQNRIKTGHRASIGIAVCKKYWNLGIGKRMFEEMIRIAEENRRILQIELEYIEGNNRARALYEKMGFRITGMKLNAICLKDGTLLNEYQMVREIKR